MGSRSYDKYDKHKYDKCTHLAARENLTFSVAGLSGGCWNSMAPHLRW